MGYLECQGPVQRSVSWLGGFGEFWRHGVWADRPLYRGKARVRFLRRGAWTRPECLALLIEETAASSRVFLSLGQHQHRRKIVGFGSLIHRHGHPALLSSHMSAVFPAFRNQLAGIRDIQP